LGAPAAPDFGAAIIEAGLVQLDPEESWSKPIPHALTDLNIIQMAKLIWTGLKDRRRLYMERRIRKGKPRSGISPNAPLCPRCGAYILKRTSSLGLFWGCTQWPSCQGKLMPARIGGGS
jgi:hypothetical protein